MYHRRAGYDLERRWPRLPRDSADKNMIPQQVPLGYIQVCILGTSKLGQCTLGSRPLVLGYSRLGDATLFTNPRNR